ncbi:MAG: hypothetical protein N838_07500 [Thiohalocapsa sp. PB-PSB1]|nr:MAG: hypothetical protein N838_07500 [Thiohalocapsa sp. PB-PSB1]
MYCPQTILLITMRIFGLEFPDKDTALTSVMMMETPWFLTILPRQKSEIIFWILLAVS